MRVESLSSGTDTNRAIENFYFSILYPIFSIRKVSTVSVPSGDFLFSNTVIKKNHTELYCMFPSPPGTSYFLIFEMYLDSVGIDCFRPLRGLLIF